MKALILVVVVLGGLFYFFSKISDWSESNNKFKQKIGCTIMAILIMGFILLNIIGFVKECSHISSPSYEYYDSPRK